jgi:hypothetical protein
VDDELHRDQLHMALGGLWMLAALTCHRDCTDELFHELWLGWGRTWAQCWKAGGASDREVVDLFERVMNMMREVAEGKPDLQHHMQTFRERIERLSGCPGLFTSIFGTGAAPDAN